MDEAAARARLSSMVAADSRPALSTAVLTDLLNAARIPDQDGRLVTDTGYVPTWNLNYAAAEGWRRKSALVAGDFSFSADDARYDKGSVLANCEKMAAMYAAMDHGTIKMGMSERPFDTDRLMTNG